MHVRSTNPEAVPLLLIHGWPGSVVECLDIIGPLRKPSASGPAVDLVIPSLVGFGFSTPLSSADGSPTRNAEFFVALMEGLGYRRYGVQGGDFGAFIGPEVGRLAPDRVIGVHINGGYLAIAPAQGRITDEDLAAMTDDERRRVAMGRYWRQERTGYFMQQATRPQTVSYGLTDAPAGQLAWIIEKFKEWTHSGNCPRTPSPGIACWPTSRCTGPPAPRVHRRTSTTRSDTRRHSPGRLRCRLRSRTSPTTWRSAASVSAYTTSSPGTSSTPADISRRSRHPICSSATFGSSSRRSVEHYRVGAQTPRSPNLRTVRGGSC